MKNDILITNITASIIILFGAICYFALQPNNEISQANEPINIVLNTQGYQPGIIQIHAGKEVKLHIVRENTEVCKTAVEFMQMNVAYPFMLDIPINVTLPPQAPGEIDFICQGGRAHGKIVVV